MRWNTGGAAQAVGTNCGNPNCNPFFKERFDLEAHERIVFGCFANLWGVAVLQEDAGGIRLCSEGC